MTSKTMFTIPIGGGLAVNQAVVVTWIIMAALTILSICLVRNLKVENIGKKQLVLETAIGGIYNSFVGIVGEKGRRYVGYLTSLILYLAVSNMIGILGFDPPTKDLNVTAPMAIMSIVLIEFAGLRQKGLLGWMKSFLKPLAGVLPLNIMEVITRPLALCMRLFGNILGAYIIMEIIKALVPVVVPVPFSAYFDIFDGLLQAYVFVFLTALFIKEAIED